VGNTVVAVHTAAADPGGIAAERDPIIERAAFTYQDWMSALAAQADIETRMVAVLGELGLTALVTTIPGTVRGGRGGDLGADRGPGAL
jgi:hypothetical protein